MTSSSPPVTQGQSLVTPVRSNVPMGVSDLDPGSQEGLMKSLHVSFAFECTTYHLLHVTNIITRHEI